MNKPKWCTHDNYDGTCCGGIKDRELKDCEEDDCSLISDDYPTKQKNNRVIGGFYFVKFEEDYNWSVCEWKDHFRNGGEWSITGSEVEQTSNEFLCIEERIKMPDEKDSK